MVKSPESIGGGTGDGGPDWSVVSNLAKGNIIDTEADISTYERRLPDRELVKDYTRDRFSQNLELLEKVGNQHFIDLYQDLMSEYPQLRMVELHDGYDDDNAGFANMGMSDSPDFYCPKVLFNFTNSEQYAINTEKEDAEIWSNDERLGRKYSVKRLALQVGANWKKCAKSKKLIADEILLHEFGHAYDFIENYLRPEYDSCPGDNRGAQALYFANKRNRANRDEYLSLGPDMGQDFALNERRDRAMGINNREERRYAIHQYYRDMPDEAYADNFAADYIKQHFDDYFTNDKSKQHERILIEKDRPVDLDPDFVHILGLKQGVGVEITKVKDGKAGDNVKGFLATNVYNGKNIYLYENGDPKDPGQKLRICKGAVSGLELRTNWAEDGQPEHYIFFSDETGARYNISRSGDTPPKVHCSPLEMAEELGFKNGSKIQLLEHLHQDARELRLSKVDKKINSILDATVISADGELASDHAIIAYKYEGKKVRLRYPITRKWKTYYIGDYEILPRAILGNETV